MATAEDLQTNTIETKQVTTMTQPTFPIDQIRSLFKARDEAHKSCTDLILDTLGPTLLFAVRTFFNLEKEDVNWVHVSVMDTDTLALIGIIAAHVKVEEELISGGVLHPNQTRYLRVGLPVSLIEKGSKEDILDYLKKAQDNNVEQTEQQQTTYENISEQLGFNLALLTDEQREKLLLSLGTPMDNKTPQ